MSASFQQVQQQLGPKRSNVRLVSISIDPENDTPAKLKEYAEKLNAGPHWKLLTGSLENSIAVQRAFGVYAGDKMNHKPLTFLKAKKSEKSWVRLEGLSDAKGIISELDKLAAK
jgi:protein SCO1/2